jgi:signal transduction histidine kinase
MSFVQVFGKNTIASHISRMNLVVSAVALALACTGFIIYDQITVRNTIASGLASQARIIAANSASAIMFDDASAATATLAPVRDIPNIQAAEIRLPSGAVFTHFSRTNDDPLQRFQLSPDQEEMQWSNSDILVYGRQINFQGSYRGSVLIASDLSPVRERLKQYAEIALLVFMLSFAAAVTFSRGIRKIISKPIEQLAEAAGKVSSERDFTFRVPLVPKISELGLLTVAFNEMLAQLERDEQERKLAELALIQSEKLAATGRMAATMAHEINNPLESVTNLLYLAQKDAALSSKSRRYLQVADQELDRVAHLAKQTLGFYRDSSSASTFNISAAIDDVLALYARRISGRNIDVEKQMDANADVLGFAGEFRQVVSNLVVNAVDAMSDDGGRLLVRTRRVSAGRLGQSGVRIIIGDTGKGIPLENQKKIFEAFFTTKENVGTGLGLWLTRGIVEKHGGVIRVRSRNGPSCAGTVFSVFWPADGAQASIKHVDQSQGSGRKTG